MLRQAGNKLEHCSSAKLSWFFYLKLAYRFDLFHTFTMNQNLIYYPCFALLILSALVLIRMFLTRVFAIKSGTVDFRYFKTYNAADGQLPMQMVQASRNFTNLFEVPTLFYMVCAFALITQHVDEIFLLMAWLYVALRYLHSAIHLTNNKITPRMTTYFFSWVVLVGMGITLATRIYYGL